MRGLYTFLMCLIAPVALVGLGWRARRRGDAPGRWRERLGLAPRIDGGVAAWVHAVSVGEVRAAAPVIAALVARHGEDGVLVTTLTTTGSEEVARAWGDRVRHCYIPFDLPPLMARFLKRVQPRVAVIMETELWPNAYAALHARGIPLVIANARLSPRSVRGYRRVGGFMRSVLAHTSMIAAQSAEDAERFLSLGAPRVDVMGNVKFDVTAPQEMVDRGKALRQRIGTERPVWVAASTRDGEETAVVAAHQEVLSWHPEALLIIVPRHPQRFSSVARGLARSGLRWAAASEGSATSFDRCHILLGDTMGEMALYLAAADVAFVGGSLVEVGGHNILEPAALGLPVLFGPHMFNFIEARRLLMEAGAAHEVSGARELAAEVAALISSSDLRQRMGGAGRAALEANRGAVDRLMALLDDIAGD
jgi:3-deoxy-D-manno-octulosonic-acid transferase